MVRDDREKRSFPRNSGRMIGVRLGHRMLDTFAVPRFQAERREVRRSFLAKRNSVNFAARYFGDNIFISTLRGGLSPPRNVANAMLIAASTERRHLALFAISFFARFALGKIPGSSDA